MLVVKGFKAESWPKCTQRMITHEVMSELHPLLYFKTFCTGVIIFLFKLTFGAGSYAC